MQGQVRLTVLMVVRRKGRSVDCATPADEKNNVDAAVHLAVANFTAQKSTRVPIKKEKMGGRTWLRRFSLGWS